MLLVYVLGCGFINTGQRPPPIVGSSIALLVVAQQPRDATAERSDGRHAHEELGPLEPPARRLEYKGDWRRIAELLEALRCQCRCVQILVNARVRTRRLAAGEPPGLHARRALLPARPREAVQEPTRLQIVCKGRK